MSNYDNLTLIDSILNIIYGTFGLILVSYAIIIKEAHLKYKYNSANNSRSLQLSSTVGSSKHIRSVSSTSDMLKNNSKLNINESSNNKKIRSISTSERNLKKRRSFYYYLRRGLLIPCLCLLAEATILLSQSKAIQMINFAAGYFASTSLFFMFSLFGHRMFVAMEKTLLFTIPTYHKYSLIFLGLILICSCLCSLILMFLFDRRWPDGIYFVGVAFSASYFGILIWFLMRHSKKSLTSRLTKSNASRVDKTINKINSTVTWIIVIIIMLMPALIFRAISSFSDTDERFFVDKIEGSFISLVFTTFLGITIVVAYRFATVIY